MPSDIQYVKNSDVSIAYRVVGDGPIDLVAVSGFVSHLEVAWEEPGNAHFVDRLSAFARVFAARMASAAGAGEILASSTVRDLTGGSGLTYQDRGQHEPKGVPGEWRLLTVAG